MSAVIDQARDLLKSRLAEVTDEAKALASEAKTLEKVITSLNGSGPTRRGRPKGSKGKPRARRSGTRADEALKLITDAPGIGASDIAKVMKIKPNYLYRVLADLEKQKLVTKKGRAYTAK